ncbi:hypothetical protein NST83_05840 [Paenibacillus sp. FSL R10-2782]|uniref:hypothetical protein n=1 Tax=Paenibacillus sp. FSL R10-2782 TaxID=2954661 RepID=UPI00315950BC
MSSPSPLRDGFDLTIAVATPDSNPSLRYSKMHHADHTVYCKRHNRTIHVRSACKDARVLAGFKYQSALPRPCSEGAA